MSSKVGMCTAGRKPPEFSSMTGQAEAGNDLDRLRQRAVVQDRVVDTELHRATASSDVASARWGGTSTDAPPWAADSATAASTSMLWTPSSKEAQRGSESASSRPGHLLQEGAGLVGEAVVLAEAHARRVHRQAAGDVRVVRADDHAAEAAAPGRALVQHQVELRRSLLRPLRGTLVAEDLDGQAVRDGRRRPGTPGPTPTPLANRALKPA